MPGGRDLQTRLERVEATLEVVEEQLRDRRAQRDEVGPVTEEYLLHALRELTTVVRDLASQGGQAISTSGH